jgi:hypothetical protein
MYLSLAFRRHYWHGDYARKHFGMDVASAVTSGAVVGNLCANVGGAKAV